MSTIKTPQKETAASLAAVLVAHFFDQLQELCIAPQVDREDALDQAHMAVQDACLAEWIAENGPAQTEEEAASYDETAAARAGYLIGVQVGLRMRKAGA